MKRHFLLHIVVAALSSALLAGCGPKKLSYAKNASGGARSGLVLPGIYRIVARSNKGFAHDHEEAAKYFSREANEVCGTEGYTELSTAQADREYRDTVSTNATGVNAVPFEVRLNMAEKKGYVLCHSSGKDIAEANQALAAHLEAERKKWMEGIE